MEGSGGEPANTFESAFAKLKAMVDGAISSPLPVSVARQMGAETVIAVAYSAGQRAIEQIRLAQNSNYKKRT